MALKIAEFIASGMCFYYIANHFKLLENIPTITITINVDCSDMVINVTQLKLVTRKLCSGDILKLYLTTKMSSIRIVTEIKNIRRKKFLRGKFN